MFDQIARKVEEIATGTPPECIKGSTTVRVAVGLIFGKCLTNSEFSDRQAWEMLDEVQKEAVIHHRPKSKYAKWFAKEKAEEERILEELRKEGRLTFVFSDGIVSNG
ncbi:hypothetical protein AB4Z52_29495 [Rhizobium sp. 2YAF20]|uniref:hypothetical protein n=1 Tax=Rhizobium sp. 2YAF20 TaxID=3233027 RepID=UPI003F9CFAEE